MPPVPIENLRIEIYLRNPVNLGHVITDCIEFNTAKSAMEPFKVGDWLSTKSTTGQTYYVPSDNVACVIVHRAENELSQDGDEK